MNRFVSLMYHNVCARGGNGEGWPAFSDLSPSVTGYFVDRETFSRHCAMIAASPPHCGCDSSSDATHKNQQSPAVQITFDDGWQGTFDEAGPILERHGLTASLFVTTDLIGRPYFADRRQLAAAGTTFTIGAHGRTHRPLATLSDDDVRDELAASKATLEDLLGREVDHMSFPGGSFDARVVRVATEVGYRKLFTSEIRVNEPSTGNRIGRIPIKSDTNDAALRRYLAGDVRPERIRGLALSTVKRLLGRRGYSIVRSRLLSETSDQLEMTDLSDRDVMIGQQP